MSQAAFLVLATWPGFSPSWVGSSVLFFRHPVPPHYAWDTKGAVPGKMNNATTAGKVYKNLLHKKPSTSTQTPARSRHIPNNNITKEDFVRNKKKGFGEEEG